jgi:hypothetical protein
MNFRLLDKKHFQRLKTLGFRRHSVNLDTAALIIVNAKDLWMTG